MVATVDTYRPINLSGFDEYLTVLERINAAAINRQPWFGAVGEYLVGSHQDRWQKGQDSQGKDWIDLKPATWEKKKNKKILFETKVMLGTRGASYDATDDGLEFGLADDKAGWHHFGTQNKDGSQRMPARELVGFSDDDKEEIVALGVDHLESATKNQN